MVVVVIVPTPTLESVRDKLVALSERSAEEVMDSLRSASEYYGRSSSYGWMNEWAINLPPPDDIPCREWLRESWQQVAKRERKTQRGFRAQMRPHRVRSVTVSAVSVTHSGKTRRGRK